MQKVAFIHEHPTWADALLREFDEQGFAIEKINVAELAFETVSSRAPRFDFAINRVNMMPSVERLPSVVFQTLHYLHWLESCGVRVVNGARAHFVGASKSTQNGVFSSLGLHCPNAIAIFQPEDALDAATKIGYPVIVKPNIGGSGTSVEKFDNAEELSLAVENKLLDLGIDRSGIVQEFVESDGFVYRVEVLGEQLFYATRQQIKSGSFNYCATEACAAPGSDEDVSDAFEIETFVPEQQIVDDVVNIVRSSGADLGGVEYFIDTRRGKRCYYDFNPYSNFVSNGETLLGFSPERRYVDFVRTLIEAA